MAVSKERARAAKEAVHRAFSRVGTVAGVGITKVGGDYAVKVNLESPLPRGSDPPDQVDGVPVKVEVVGKITPR